jgi:acetyltransferase-like isoleucine patch superfamily enzyme
MSPLLEASVLEQPLLIVGAGFVLKQCAAAWQEAQPERNIRILEAAALDHVNRAMDAFPASEWRAFGVLPASGVNMARLKLMVDLRLKGYKLESFVSPTASVPRGLKLAENCFINAGAVIEEEVKTRDNLFVGARAVIGYGSELGHSVWIGAGALLGARISVGDNCVIGSGASLADDMRVGELCELNIAQEYRRSVEAKTFFSPIFDGPMRIYGARG